MIENAHIDTLTAFQRAVYTVVRRIPRGRVATYVQVARAIGHPRAARAVGNVLHHNPYTARNGYHGRMVVPCHRVVRSDLRVGGYARGAKEKIRMLRKEGVSVFVKGKIFRSISYPNFSPARFAETTAAYNVDGNASGSQNYAIA